MITCPMYLCLTILALLNFCTMYLYFAILAPSNSVKKRKILPYLKRMR